MSGQDDVSIELQQILRDHQLLKNEVEENKKGLKAAQAENFALKSEIATLKAERDSLRSSQKSNTNEPSHPPTNEQIINKNPADFNSDTNPTIPSTQQILYHDEHSNSTNIEMKWDNINQRIIELLRRRSNNNEQYHKRKTLLLHRLTDVPKRPEGRNDNIKYAYDFIDYCIGKLNEHFGEILKRPLVPEDIDRAHILRTKKQSSKPVVLVQFMNMTVRNVIFFSKRVLKGKNFSISEHLTADNMDLLNAAEKTYGQAWSSDCQIFALCDGVKRRIFSHADLVSNMGPGSNRTNTKRYSPRHSNYPQQFPLPSQPAARYPMHPQPKADINFDSYIRLDVTYLTPQGQWSF